MSSSNSTTPVKTDPEQTSISLNDTESIRKLEPKKQVNIVISYIEQNDEQGIAELVKPSLSLELVVQFQDWLKVLFWYIPRTATFPHRIASP